MQVLAGSVKCLALAIFFAPALSALGQAATGGGMDSPKEVVRRFLAEVRSGRFPENARIYMADTVIAHQVQSESPVTVDVFGGRTGRLSTNNFFTTIKYYRPCSQIH